MELPAAGAFGTGVVADLTAADAATLHNDVLEAVRQHAGATSATDLTIATGSITPTSWCHAVDTESAAAADDLTKIDPSSVPDGHLLLLFPKDINRVVTVKTAVVGVGKIVLDGGTDFVMKGAHNRLLLRREGTVWKELMRVTFLPSGEPHGRQVFTASGDFTVPDGVDTVWVTSLGGGGGGGGGGGTNGDSPNTGGNGDAGSSGSASAFGAITGAGGGAGGFGGHANGSTSGATAGRNLPGGDPAYLALNGVVSVKARGAWPLSSPLPGYGQGGKGGDGGLTSSDAGPSGGASGQLAVFVSRYPVTSVVAGQVVAVTVGAGGAGGAGGTGSTTGSDGSDGADGIVIVEW